MVGGPLHARSARAGRLAGGDRRRAEDHDHQYIGYTIQEEQGHAFTEAYRRAAEALEASEHCERYEVSRCTEDPTQHVVRIEWDSTYGHLSGFRRSPEFRRFFEAVGPFVNDIEEMRHYELTVSSANGSR